MRRAGPKDLPFFYPFMKKINSSQINIRILSLDDYDQLVALHSKCFPEMLPWKKEQIESQMQIFPEGQICIEVEGVLIASSNSLITTIDLKEDHVWGKVTDQGYIRNHNPEGDTLYGMEIMVDPDYQKQGLATKLYEARKELVRKKGLKRIVIAGRMPGYGKIASQMTPETYMDKVAAGDQADPVITPQMRNGFQPIKVLPNYFPLDKESLGYAILMEWKS